MKYDAIIIEVLHFKFWKQLMLFALYNSLQNNNVYY